ncbi:MAG: type II toxin-antitoxin system VapC family toxin [Actinomycetota bacterium]
MPVIDASAFLAYLLDEPGADAVEQALAGRATMSAVNLAEVLSKLSDIGLQPDKEAERLRTEGILGVALKVESAREELAIEIARLRPITKPYGLSIGDRACIALGRLLQVAVLTADRTWADIPGLEVKIECIR